MTPRHPQERPVELREADRAYIARRCIERPGITLRELAAELSAQPGRPTITYETVRVDLNAIKAHWRAEQDAYAAVALPYELSVLDYIVSEAIHAWTASGREHRKELVSELTRQRPPFDLKLDDSTPGNLKGVVAEALKAFRGAPQDSRRSELQIEQRDPNPAYLAVALRAAMQRQRLRGLEPEPDRNGAPPTSPVVVTHVEVVMPPPPEAAPPLVLDVLPDTEPA